VTEKVPITGTVLEIIGEQMDSVGILWYKTLYKNNSGYVRGNLIDPMTPEDTAKWLAQEQIAKEKADSAKSKSPMQRPAGIHSAGAPQTPVVYPPDMTVWIGVDGLYHSSQTCSGVGQPQRSCTLAQAQGQGLSACPYCFCLDCLFPGG